MGGHRGACKPVSLNQKPETISPREGVLNIAYTHFAGVALTWMGLCSLVDEVVNRGDAVSIATAGALTAVFTATAVCGIHKCIEAADRAQTASEKTDSKPPAP